MGTVALCAMLRWWLAEALRYVHRGYWLWIKRRTASEPDLTPFRSGVAVLIWNYSSLDLTFTFILSTLSFSVVCVKTQLLIYMISQTYLWGLSDHRYRPVQALFEYRSSDKWQSSMAGSLFLRRNGNRQRSTSTLIRHLNTGPIFLLVHRPLFSAMRYCATSGRQCIVPQGDVRFFNETGTSEIPIWGNEPTQMGIGCSHEWTDGGGECSLLVGRKKQHCFERGVGVEKERDFMDGKSLLLNDPSESAYKRCRLRPSHRFERTSRDRWSVLFDHDRLLTHSLDVDHDCDLA